jgi:hypothetical protein
MQTLLINDYPEAHRPVVAAMQNLNGGNILTEVPLGSLHNELRRMGFTNAPSHLVSLAATARVVRRFNDKKHRMVAVLESAEMSRSSSS